MNLPAVTVVVLLSPVHKNTLPILELTITLGTAYAQSDINAAAQKALELASKGQTLGMYHQCSTKNAPLPDPED